MKKFINIAFVIFFSLLTVGITVHKHYSGGELFSFAVFAEAESCCDEPCNCCDDETEIIQFTTDYLFSSITKYQQADFFLLEITENPQAMLALIMEQDNLKPAFRKMGKPPPVGKAFLSHIQNFRL